ncbi:hypothetical protein BDD12DRAFT_884289 [Trichophaea hybrida]|nr:hypothetical protein BDD12DRAFT_884289 [Trichophaea hybrida]
MSTTDSSSLSSVPSSFSLMPQRLLPCVQRQSVFSADWRRKLGDDIVQAQEIFKFSMRNGLLQFEQAVSIIRLLDAAAKLENAKD